MTPEKLDLYLTLRRKLLCLPDVRVRLEDDLHLGYARVHLHDEASGARTAFSVSYENHRIVVPLTVASYIWRVRAHGVTLRTARAFATMKFPTNEEKS